MLDHFNEEKPAGGYYTGKTLFQERDELPDDRELLMTATARGKNAEALAAAKENPPSVSSADRPKTPEGGAKEGAKEERIAAAPEGPRNDNSPSVSSADTSPRGGGKAPEEQSRKTEVRAQKAPPREAGR